MNSDAAGIEIAMQYSLRVEFPEPSGGLGTEFKNTPIMVVVVAVQRVFAQGKPLFA